MLHYRFPEHIPKEILIYYEDESGELAAVLFRCPYLNYFNTGNKDNFNLGNEEERIKRLIENNRNYLLDDGEYVLNHFRVGFRFINNVNKDIAVYNNLLGDQSLYIAKCEYKNIEEHRLYNPELYI